MYKAPSEEDFDFITSFWTFKIIEEMQKIKDTSVLSPCHIIAQNRHYAETKVKLFDFNMSINYGMFAVMHFKPVTEFKSKTYEETLTILSIKEIIKHVRINTGKKLYFHSIHEPVLESMFTVGFEKYTIVTINKGGTSVCAQKTI